MDNTTKAFIGLDVHKETISLAVAEADGKKDLYFFGTIPNDKVIIKKKLEELKKRYSSIEMVYEAGPCGYGLQRFLSKEHYICHITPPSTIPDIKSNHIKNDHRDSKNLARLLRMGELVHIWIPDETHEAIRELVRVRHAARKDVKKAKQRVQSFLLKYERDYSGKAWTNQHRVWLRNQSFDHIALQISFQTYLNSLEQIEERIKQIEEQMKVLCENWKLKEAVKALQALKGVGFIIAISIVAEIGDPARFPHPKNLIAFLGLIPGEHSSGSKTISKGITKTGSIELRSLLYEAAWNYTKTPKVGQFMKLHVPEETPQFAKDISWKAQLRLNRRYKKLVSRGKKSQVAITAVSRELVGFIWSICTQVSLTKPIAA